MITHHRKSANIKWQDLELSFLEYLRSPGTEIVCQLQQIQAQIGQKHREDLSGSEHVGVDSKNQQKSNYSAVLGTSRFDYVDQITYWKKKIAEGQAKYQSAREGFGAEFEVGVDHVKRACEWEWRAYEIDVAD